MLNSFSNSIINSTVSKESAPRSLVKLAYAATSLSSTPNLSMIIAFTLDAISDILFIFYSYKVQIKTFLYNYSNILAIGNQQFYKTL